MGTHNIDVTAHNNRFAGYYSKGEVDTKLAEKVGVGDAPKYPLVACQGVEILGDAYYTKTTSGIVVLVAIFKTDIVLDKPLAILPVGFRPRIYLELPATLSGADAGAGSGGCVSTHYGITPDGGIIVRTATQMSNVAIFIANSFSCA